MAFHLYTSFGLIYASNCAAIFHIPLNRRADDIRDNDRNRMLKRPEKQQHQDVAVSAYLCPAGQLTIGSKRKLR